MTARGKTTQVSTNGSFKPHAGGRSRVEPDDDGLEMMREPSDRDILAEPAEDNDPVEVDFGPLDWDLDFTGAQRLVLGYQSLDIDKINGYRAAGVDDYPTMSEYDRFDLSGPLIAAYAVQGCGANEALLLHRAGVTPKAWATYRADDADIAPVEAVALKKAKIGKQMFTELRALGVTDADQMVAIAKRFSGKDLATWRRQGVVLADLYDADGKLEEPKPTRLALVREFGLSPDLAATVDSCLRDLRATRPLQLDARVVDRAVELVEFGENGRGSRYAIAGWAQAATPIDLAKRGVAAGVDFDDLVATAGGAEVGELSRVLAAVERRRSGDSEGVDAKTVLSTIREFSRVRPLTDSELDDAALLADHSAHNRYQRVIATAPGGTADSRGFRRPEFDPVSMSKLAATARGTGDPRLFLMNLADFQRKSLVADGVEGIISKAEAAAKIGRTYSEVERAAQAGAKTIAEVQSVFAQLDRASAELGFTPGSVGPSSTRKLKL